MRTYEFIKNYLKKALQSNVKADIVYIGSILSCKFNVKDKTPFEEQHDVLNRAVYVTDNYTEDYDEDYVGSVYSLFIVNVSKCYIMAYLCRTLNRCSIYWSSCKTLVCSCAND